MKLAELTAYAARKYNICEEFRWLEHPGFSVLCHPQTGKLIALLIRHWDPDLGAELEFCDLRCGNSVPPRPYLTRPLRMKGSAWRCISFDRRTEREVVFSLFDKAVRGRDPHGYKVVLASQLPRKESGYKDTALPFASSSYRPQKEKLPEKLREMKRLYEYGRETVEAKARNFYRQAVFMKDYEDDHPWSGEFVCYYPTYHDMTTDQLRGYFSWRTRLRKGEFRPIPASAAYIYVYELLNGIGADSPENVLRKLSEFEAGYLDSGIGDQRMRGYLRSWALEYAVLKGLSPEAVRNAADPEMLKRDVALDILRSPGERPDGEVFEALCAFALGKPADSPVIKSGPERGMKLFADAWRRALAYERQGTGLFELCFGKPDVRRWMPLSRAVYYERSIPGDTEVILNGCRSYTCKDGRWTETSYEASAFDRVLFRGFIHETDARLRRYLKTGRYLREDPSDSWAIPFIDAVIEADRQALLEASRPKITIDLSGLDRIRRDAAVTRDSLLIEEETDEPAEESLPDTEPEECGLPLNGVQIKLLRTLLRGGDPSDILKEEHLMPSVAADEISEALFDEFGDTVIVCEDDRLSLMEDYIEELEQMLGGNKNG